MHRVGAYVITTGYDHHGRARNIPCGIRGQIVGIEGKDELPRYIVKVFPPFPEDIAKTLEGARFSGCLWFHEEDLQVTGYKVLDWLSGVGL